MKRLLSYTNLVGRSIVLSAQVISVKVDSTTLGFRDSVVDRVRSGDIEAFSDIYQKYRFLVARLACNIAGPRQDLEDIVQEVFLQIYKSLGSFQKESKFSTWIYRLTVNVVLQYLRKNRKFDRVMHDSDDDAVLHESGPSPEDATFHRERRRILMDALSTISLKKRVVFILHEIEGMEAQEIARVLGIPVLTVRTRLFYARKAVYKILMKNPAFK